MAKYSRRDEKLDKLLGERVKVTFFDGYTVEGILYWCKPEVPTGAIYREDYSVGDLHFYKSVVKKIEKTY